jgi:phosphoribosylanthranilate isomerase
MILKVCGLKDNKNIEQLLAVKPNLMGFIFYNKSKRFVSQFPQSALTDKIQKVGVFVNESIENIIETINKFQLQYVQLHGNETVDYCSKLFDKSKNNKTVNFKIIKAFAVDDNFKFFETIDFEPFCSYFLFDTKGLNYGGNGQKFNWYILKNYTGNTPFLLSGGIQPQDAQLIQSFKHPKFVGIDINSGFELQPGVKNVAQIKQFKQQLK